MGTQKEISEVAERVRRFENLNQHVTHGRIISNSITQTPNIDNVAATLYSRLLSIQDGNRDYIQSKLIAQQAVLDELFLVQVEMARKSGKHSERLELIDSAYKAAAGSRHCLATLLQSQRDEVAACDSAYNKVKGRGSKSLIP